MNAPKGMPESYVAVIGESKEAARARQAGFDSLASHDAFANLPPDPILNKQPHKVIASMTGEEIRTDLPFKSSTQSNPNSNTMNLETPQSPRATDTTFTVTIEATVDGVTLTRYPLATKKKTVKGTALQYKNRFVLPDGSAIYTVGLTQAEALQMAADSKPMQKATQVLEREAMALQAEHKRLKTSLEGEGELSTAERAAMQARRGEVEARLDELSEQRERQQIESLTIVDSLLKEKVVALDWEDNGETHRTADLEDLMQDLEMKMAVSSLLMGGTGQGQNQGQRDFLAPR